MPIGEFALIERYFRACGAGRDDVRLGVGDDAALLDVPAGCELVAALDTLVEGRHFPRGSPARSIGHRALAVNLSDLAAMGARPAWALLGLTLPQPQAEWLEAFSGGLDELARTHGVALVGGDTTAGALTVTIQVLGLVERGTALRRCGARPGDQLFVSGHPGDAAAGLALEQGRLEAGRADDAAYLRTQFLYPAPRLALGGRLRGLASACIDVSDGLLGDAGKLARASGGGVEIDYASLPVSPALVRTAGERRARELALTGGDDYELCFAVPPERLAELERTVPQAQWGWCRIGELRAAPGAVVLDRGTVMEFADSGFEHF